MKRFWFLILISAVSLNSMYTQTNPAVAIAINDLNEVFIGIDNPITIVASGIACEALRVEMTEGSIKGSDCQYILRIAKKVGITTLNVYSGNIKIGSVDFIVHSLPAPVVEIAGKSGGEITIKELLSQPFLVARIPDFEFDAMFRVTSFSLRYEDESNQVIRASNHNLTEEMKEMIRQFIIGQKISFEDITAVNPDGTVIILSSIFFTIK